MLEFTTPENSILKFTDNLMLEDVKVEKEGKFIDTNSHVFLTAVHLAYVNRISLVISPDIIWYLISVQVSYCEKQIKKTIKRDDFILGKRNPWNEEIDKLIKLPERGFSTTTKESKIAFEMLGLGSKKNDGLLFACLAGSIPEIRLTGEKKDWVELQSRVEKISDELAYWKKNLNFILENFIIAFDDIIDITFWKKIYKIRNKKDATYISGWINLLLGLEITEVRSDSFQKSLNTIPFIWDHFGNKLNMQLLSGLLGIIYNDESLLPVFGYAISADMESDSESESSLEISFDSSEHE